MKSICRQNEVRVWGWQRQVSARVVNRVPVSGSSMAPLLQAGDVLEVDLHLERLCVGDVVVFRSGAELVVHRVVQIRGGKQDAAAAPLALLTKGDRLWWFDRPVSPEQVLGKVRVVHSPRGSFSLQTPAARVMNLWAARLSWGQALAWNGLRRVRGRTLSRVCRLVLLLPLWTALYAWRWVGRGARI